MKKSLFALLSLVFALGSLTALAENTAIMPEPRAFPTNWMSRHETLVQQAKRGGVDILFLDIGSKLLEKDGTLSTDVMPDLLHLNEKGYQIWADAMEETLAGMLK